MTEHLKITPPEPPEPPEHLPDEGRRLWRQLAPQIAENGILAPAQATSLEIACQAYADWREHTARVAEQGALVKSPNGFAVQHPSISIANRAADTWRKIVRQLGLDKKQPRRPDSKVGSLISKRSS